MTSKQIRHRPSQISSSPCHLKGRYSGLLHEMEALLGKVWWVVILREQGTTFCKINNKVRLFSEWTSLYLCDYLYKELKTK